MCIDLRSASWKTELVYEWVRHLDVHHFVIEEGSHNYSERLLNQMWLHRCYVVPLYIMSAIIYDMNTIGFISEYACRVYDSLVARCATLHYATPPSMHQNGRPTLN